LFFSALPSIAAFNTHVCVCSCGRSAAPDASEAQYSVESSVRDLQVVVKALGLRKYHMLGQSWGGILGYEFLKSGAGGGNEDEGCQSFILSNTPTSVAQVEADVASLIGALGSESRPDLAQAFSQAHECRLPQRPKLLVDAYAHAGTVWRGTDAIKAWKLQHHAPKITTPTLVLRGEHDFVTEASQEGWSEAFARLRYKCVPDASHHTLLEKQDDYLEIVDNFTAEFD
jgi:pimeloyl-ACP methyl ester carboxylesterase